MKAVRHLPKPAARFGVALAATALIAACSPAATAPPQARPAAPPAAPAQMTRPSALPPSAALPASPGSRWMDMPRSPGAWRYAASGGRTTATFVSPSGAPLSRLICLADSRAVVLSLPESGVRGALVTIRTETASRTFEAQSRDRDMTVTLAASDPLLDAMALSKGTFALEADGLPPLYLPSWAEVSRVIEDCR